MTREGLSVAITWELARSRKQGSHTYRVSLTRWYQDRERAWRNTASLHADDFPKIAGLMTECIAKLR